MNRLDKIVVLVVALFVGLAFLRTVLDVAAQAAAVVGFLGAGYAVFRLWQGGKLGFLKTMNPFAAVPAPPPAPATEKKE